MKSHFFFKFSGKTAPAQSHATVPSCILTCFLFFLFRFIFCRSLSSSLLSRYPGNYGLESHEGFFHLWPRILKPKSFSLRVRNRIWGGWGLRQFTTLHSNLAQNFLSQVSPNKNWSSPFDASWVSPTEEAVLWTHKTVPITTGAVPYEWVRLKKLRRSPRLDPPLPSCLTRIFCQQNDFKHFWSLIRY